MQRFFELSTIWVSLNQLEHLVPGMGTVDIIGCVGDCEGARKGVSKVVKAPVETRFGPRRKVILSDGRQNLEVIITLREGCPPRSFQSGETSFPSPCFNI